MAKKLGGFAAKSAKARDKRSYSLVKYVKSVKSEKSGFWRFQEEHLKVMDGEDITAAIKRYEAQLHPAPENIPVIQPEEPVEAKTEVEAEAKAEAKAEAEAEDAEAVTEEAETVAEEN